MIPIMSNNEGRSKGKVWNKEDILDKKSIIYNTLENIGTDWMMNLICLKDGKSYIIASNSEVQRKLENLFDDRFQNDILVMDNVWLRKEIIKKAINFRK